MYNALARFCDEYRSSSDKGKVGLEEQGEFLQLKTVKKPVVLYHLTFSLVLVSWQMVLRHLLFSFRLIV